MNQQLTLKGSFSVSGKGLHTGLPITATLKPAPVGTGLCFKRVDLENQPEIRALAEFVEQTERGTVLVKDGVTVSTIEHACAALYAAGIDNCLIEVDGPEVPILDGSAIEFVKGIEQVGVEEQAAEKDYYIVHEKIEVSDPKTGASLVVLPYDDFSITCLISFNSPILNNQFARLNRMEEFGEEIAACRTFVFVREIELLLKHNLIKGGDLDNALVIYDQPTSQEELDRIADIMKVPHKSTEQLGYINNSPLRFENEPARHKLLDLTGDIALIGKPLKGHIIATRPGHKINNQLARQIRAEIKRQEVRAPRVNLNDKPVYDSMQIRDILPHRWPFQLVDKVMSIEKRSIVSVKNVSINESFFLGHFPEEPIMPGVLQLEALAQTGGIYILSQMDDPKNYLTFLTKIEYARFRGKVKPGDTLVMKVIQTVPLSHGISKMKGYAFVGNELVTEVEMSAIFQKKQ